CIERVPAHERPLGQSEETSDLVQTLRGRVHEGPLAIGCPALEVREQLLVGDPAAVSMRAPDPYEAGLGGVVLVVRAGALGGREPGLHAALVLREEPRLSVWDAALRGDFIGPLRDFSLGGLFEGQLAGE